MENNTSRIAVSRSIFGRLLPRQPMHWVGVVLVLGALAAIGGVAVVVGGFANISAIPPHPVGWAHFLRYTSMHSFARHADPPPSAEPLTADAMIMRGATQFAMECESCHGAPGFGQSPVALSTRPEPPFLPTSVNDYTDAELYYVVQNGVRYTGMPAWPVANRPDEIWALVAFLKVMPKMNRDNYVALSRGSVNGVRGGSYSNGEVNETPSGKGSFVITPFVASKDDRPYLPGDPQDPFGSPLATALPRASFSAVSGGGAGDVRLAACVGCHGPDGAGRPGGAFPNLTLQTPQYLYDALNAFATGQRQSGIMWPVAAALSDAEMRRLATEIGTGPSLLSPASSGSPPSVAALGEDVAGGMPKAGRDPAGEPSSTTELSSTKVERCASCHLPAVGLDRVIPRIDGQNAAYLRTQLRAFCDGGRGDTSNYNPMQKASHNLSDGEITEVAAYYASRPPVPKN